MISVITRRAGPKTSKFLLVILISSIKFPESAPLCSHFYVRPDLARVRSENRPKPIKARIVSQSFSRGELFVSGSLASYAPLGRISFSHGHLKLYCRSIQLRGGWSVWPGHRVWVLVLVLVEISYTRSAGFPI